MNLSTITSRVEHIGGIEISDMAVRAVLYKNKTHRNSAHTVYAEVELGSDVIVDGEVVDTEKLTAALLALQAKASFNTHYFIVSIPSKSVYVKIMSFPPSVTGTRLTSALNLNLNLQSPFPADSYYMDYEKVDSEHENKIAVVMSDKTIIDAYTTALTNAKIKTVAIEFHGMSIARLVPRLPNPVMLYNTLAESIEVYIIENNAVHFTRTIPQTIAFSTEAIKEELRKIECYYSTEYNKEVTHLILDSISPELKLPTMIYPPGKWIIALGAATRGMIPPGKDTINSLLPVGTEEAYSYQAASGFTALLENTTIGIAIFFVVAYCAVWGLMISIEGHSSQTIVNLSNVSLTPEILVTENKTRDFNNLIDVTSTIVKETPEWSLFIETLKKQVPDSITITTLSFSIPEEPIRIAGIAKSRNELNAFKKILENTPMFTDVVLPLNNLEKKGDLPFTITFNLKNPADLYFK
jgi:hypothetical protein